MSVCMCCSEWPGRHAVHLCLYVVHEFIALGVGGNVCVKNLVMAKFAKEAV